MPAVLTEHVVSIRAEREYFVDGPCNVHTEHSMTGVSLETAGLACVFRITTSKTNIQVYMMLIKCLSSSAMIYRQTFAYC